MARKTARKKKTAAPAAPSAAEEKTEPSATNGTATNAQRKPAPKARARAKRPRRPAVRVATRQTRRTTRPRTSDVRRQEILEIAAREGLTGAQVAKRFGISQVTYYLWRKKAGASGRSVGAPRRETTLLDGDVEAGIRAQVRSALSAMLPQLIEEEIEAAFGGRR